MKRASLCLVLAVSAFLPLAVRAQEPIESEFEFIRKLRLKGHVSDAKEYLDEMQKRNDPKINALMPLEQARTIVIFARDKGSDQRLALLAEAHASLQKFISANPGKLEAIEATRELAQLSSMQGEALLAQALRGEDEQKVIHEKARPAEAKFVQAEKELAEAVKTLQQAAENFKDADPKAEAKAREQLAEDQLQAQVEQGINYLDQARTYIDTFQPAVNKTRSDLVEKAKVIFDGISKKNEGNIASLADAWMMKVQMENQDPQEVVRYYKKVMGPERTTGTAARRWARLFHMQNYLKDPMIKKSDAEKLKDIESEGRSWMKNYPAFASAPEGQAVLYELGVALYLQGKAAKDQKSKAALDLYEEAGKNFGKLAEMDGELAKQASGLKDKIIFETIGQKTDLKTFDDYFTKGKVEYGKLKANFAALNKEGLEDSKRPALEKELKQRLGEVKKAFRTALVLATPRTPIRDTDDARYYLTWTYYFASDLPRAVIAGEALARSLPPTPMASSGASVSLDLYAEMLRREPDPTTRARLEDLASYILSPECQKYWANDPVTNSARYHLAMLYNQDGKVKEAMDYLGKLTPTFPNFIYAQGQYIFMALDLRDKAESEDEKKKLAELARQAIQKLPTLPDGAEPSTAQMWFLAQMELAKFLYADAATEMNATPPQAKKAAEKYGEMAKLLKSLQERYGKTNTHLSPKAKDRLEYTAGVLQKYADLGLAKIDFLEGTPEAFGRVIATTKPVVDLVLKDPDKQFKDAEITAAVLGLALRANVQAGSFEQAKAILDAIQKLGGDGGQSPLRSILAEIATQVRHLKNSKEEKDKAHLKEMQGKFGTFLDTIRKAMKNPDAESIRNLADAFLTLDKTDSAVEMLKAYPAPKILDAELKTLPGKKFSDADDKAIGTYWSMQLKLAQALRQTTKEGKEKEKDLKEAGAILNRMLKHPNGRFHISAQMEKNLVMEDEHFYGPAAAAWALFLKNPNLKFGDPEAQKVLFPAMFYRSRCLYKFGQYDPNVKDKKKFFHASVRDLVAIELATDKIGWPFVSAMVAELKRAEPTFNAEYESEKKERLEKLKVQKK